MRPCLTILWMSSLTQPVYLPQVRSWECAGGALVGLFTSLTICYGIFRLITMKYGAGAPFVSDSLLAYMLAEDGVLHEWSAFMRMLMGR